MRASFRASTSATRIVPLSLRFRFLVLLVRMCCLNAAPRRNLPFFVRLKRFAAPRCVFSLIFFAICSHVKRRTRRTRSRKLFLSACSAISLVDRRRLLGCRRRRRRGLRLAAAALGPARQDGVHL